MLLSLQLRLAASNKLLQLIDPPVVSKDVINQPIPQTHNIIGSLLLSPWLNLANDDFHIDDEMYRKMGGFDYLRPGMGLICSAAYIGLSHDKPLEKLPIYFSCYDTAKNLPRLNPQHPLISPLYGNYSHWPFGTLYLQVGDSEILSKDFTYFVETLKRNEVQDDKPLLIEDIEPGMIHVYAMMGLFIGKRATVALNRCVNYIVLVMGDTFE